MKLGAGQPGGRGAKRRIIPQPANPCTMVQKPQFAFHCALDLIRTPDIKQAGFDDATQWRRSPVRATRRARREARSNPSAGKQKIKKINLLQTSLSNPAQLAPRRSGWHGHQWYDLITLLVRFVRDHYGDCPQNYYVDGSAR